MTTSIDAPADRQPPDPEPRSAIPGPGESARPPVLADGVELLGELAGSGHQQAPSLVRRGDGSMLQLTPLLYGVLQEIDGERGYDEIAPRLSERIGKTAAAEDVRYLVEKKLEPLGVLQRSDGSGPVTKKPNPLLALRPRVVLSNPDVTRRVTGPFARLFAPLIAVPVIVAFGVSAGWVLFDKGLAGPTHQAFYQPGLLLTVFALTVVSAGFHEFGHAAACRRGGATPGTMGFGLYIVWPAFYTDVSDSYRLDRRRRLLVDLGGLYFNALFSVGALAVWFLTGWDALLLVVGLQVLQMLRQLTPVIRADGYHILADITGVPDLFAHLGPTIRSLWPGNWRRRDSRSLKRWARVVVLLWVALIVPSLVFALVSGAVMMPRLAATAWDSLGIQWGRLVDGIGAGDYGTGAVSALKMVGVVLPVAGLLLLLGRTALRTGRKTLAWASGSSRRRAVAAVAAVAVVAALGWYWWPRDQYVPVRSDERGTVLQLGAALSPTSHGAARTVVLDRPTAGAAGTQRTALLLVPRQQGASSRPALVVLPSRNGGRPQVLGIPPRPDATNDPAGGPAANPWPFPFDPPTDAAPGDNRAMTVNTKDGTAIYDVAFSVVWVSGEDVEQRNEAVALANCSNCTSVSVAFQTIFLIGRSDVVAPVNTSLAVNYGCRDCRTTAIAVQLVASLTALPDPETMAQLNEIWRKLDRLAGEIPDLSDQEIVDRLAALQTEILQTLDRAGSAVTDAADAATVATGGGQPGAEDPAASPSPSPAPGTHSGGGAGASQAGGSTGSGATGSEGDSGTGSGTAGTGAGPTPGPTGSSYAPTSSGTASPAPATGTGASSGSASSAGG